jgi:hypothetical protein
MTCNTTGTSSFDVDSSVWGLLDDSTMADTNYLYVGFRNTGDVQSPDGQRAEVETRALHVIGLTNL